MHGQPAFAFLGRAGRILNSGQARTVLLTGNLHDLFWVATPEGRPGSLPEGGKAVSAQVEGEAEEMAPSGDWIPLVDFLRRHWSVAGKILLVYELNGPIRFANEADRQKLEDGWLRWRTGLDQNQMAIEAMLALGKGARAAGRSAEASQLSETLKRNLQSAIGNPTVAFELLRQMCLCSRFRLADGRPALEEDLIILVEAADLAMPDGEVTSLSDADRRRLAICQDWFSDPGYLEANDSVVLLAESRSLLHHRLARMPQILEVEVPSPDYATRHSYLRAFEERLAETGSEVDLGGLAELTAGLSIHALAQLVKGATHGGEALARDDVVARVEVFVRSQLGDDVVEIKKPSHRLDDVVGFESLKEFLRGELIPRFQVSGSAALPGAAVAGPIGSGKTFIFEAVAAELDMVVLVLKNLRSQWFGQTDVVFERLRRVLEALSRVVIFVDEADTQFGGVGAGTHATERRLTGKIQQMMSDSSLRGRVFWLLMTARIHRLSPDIRRPGRVGDLIIPVLDPAAEDRRDFVRWVWAGAGHPTPPEEAVLRLDGATQGYSAAAFAALRSRLKAQTKLADGSLNLESVLAIVHDQLPADISQTRRYQTLQALINCTRRSLLPDPSIDEEDRRAWARELRQLEARGVE